MRMVTVLALVFFFSPIALKAQTPPEWQRVYTFDDSFIEMNAFWMLNDSDGVFRVTFRWSFARPQAVRGNPTLTYKSRLDVFQFNCAERRSRLYEAHIVNAKGESVTLVWRDAAGDWRPVSPGSMTERLFAPACKLIESKLRLPAASPDEALETEKALRFALAFARRLEWTKDFAPLIGEFFAPEYLSGHLRDRDTNWLAPLDRDTAAKATRAELQKFHTAVLNAAYLAGTYVVSKPASASGKAVPEAELIPPDVIRLIESHPYTAARRGTKGGYDFLAGSIDGVEQLRSYTDLLERVGGLLRKHAAEAGGGKHKERWASFGDTFGVDPPQTRVCATECLGLPAGTKLFRVNVPVFQLQLAEINGALKIVSIGPYSE
jgi:hypothetical protein